MCGRLPGISADDSRFFLVQEELQRLLVDEAEEAEANCTVDELRKKRSQDEFCIQARCSRLFIRGLDDRRL